MTIPHLAIGSHTLTATLDGYHTITQPVTITAGTTTIPLNLVPAAGSRYLESVPSGADVYVDGVHKGITRVTVDDVAVGSREVKFTKSMYGDNTVYVTVFDGQTANVNVVMDAVDSDDDGIYDYVEFDGYPDQYGNWHWSDITLVDSDADGNDDGVEAGTPFVTKDGHTIWKIAGDALNKDTDGDGASDYVEMTLFGTDPLTAAPNLAPEILLHQTITIHTENVHLKTYARMGGVFGETGIKDGSMNWLVGDNVASSFPYFTGWMASGYFAVGDVRDLAETIYQGDGTGTALNAVAFAPAVGDATKTGNTLRKLATKYPSRINEIVKTLIRSLSDSTPIAVKSVLVNAHNGREAEIITKLKAAGMADSEIWTMAKTGDGLIENFIQKNIGDFNAAAKANNAPVFVRNKEYVVIGSGWKATGDVNFVDVAKQLEKDGTPVNYCYFEGNVGWSKDINDK